MTYSKLRNANKTLCFKSHACSRMALWAGKRCPHDLFSPPPFKERCCTGSLALSAGAESRSPLSEHPVQSGGHVVCGRVWPRRRCGHRSGLKVPMCVCVCVCFGRGVLGRHRGDGQDTTALNKVLCESQSHIPLNSEKLRKPAEEEGTRRERPRDLLGVVVRKGCRSLVLAGRGMGQKQAEFGQQRGVPAHPQALCSGQSPGSLRPGVLQPCQTGDRPCCHEQELARCLLAPRQAWRPRGAGAGGTNTQGKGLAPLAGEAGGSEPFQGVASPKGSYPPV